MFDWFYSSGIKQPVYITVSTTPVIELQPNNTQ